MECAPCLLGPPWGSPGLNTNLWRIVVVLSCGGGAACTLITQKSIVLLFGSTCFLVFSGVRAWYLRNQSLWKEPSSAEPQPAPTRKGVEGLLQGGDAEPGAPTR